MQQLLLTLKHCAKVSALLMILITSYIFSQETDTGTTSSAWLQRAYPYDTIPQNAYANALSLQSTNDGYEGFLIGGSWTSIGPTIDGSGAGRVACVKYDPSNSSIIYVGAHGGGVWKSTDGGSTFHPITESIPTQASGSFCIDPNNTSILYYATGGNIENFLYNYYGLGVFKSTDGGSTWTGGSNINYPKFTFSYCVLVNPHSGHSNYVYLANNNGLYLSTNSGVNWSHSGSISSGACSDIVTSNNGSIVYAVGGYCGLLWPPGNSGIGYWKSTDYGDNFVHETGTGFEPDQRTAIAISKDNDNYLYAVTNTGGNVVCYMSTNAGVSFPNNTNIHAGSESMASDFLFVQASPYDHLVAFVGWGDGYKHERLFKTTNGGSNFSEVAPTYGADQNCLDFNPSSSSTILCGDDQGLWRSTDLGSSWTGLNSVLSLSEGYRVTSDVSNPNVIMIGVEDGGFVRTTNGGSSWSIIDFGRDGTNVIFSLLDPNPDYNQKHVIGSKGASGSTSPLVRYSTDGGASFTTSDLDGFWDGYEDWIAVIKEDPKLQGVFFSPLRGASPNQDKIYINITTNYGENWYPTHIGTTYNPISTTDPCESPQNFAISEKDTNIMFVSTIDYGTGTCSDPGSRLWKSTDAGHTWNNLFVNSHGVPNRYISSITTDPNNADVAYLTVSGFGSSHVFKTYNGGANWTDINGMGGSPAGLPDIPVNGLSLRYIDDSHKQLIISTDIGIYTVTEIDDIGGSYTWQEYATGLPHAIVLGLNINEPGGKLRASTFGRGVFETPLTGSMAVVTDQNIGVGCSTIDVNEDIVVYYGGSLKIPSSCTVRMKAGTKITVKAGGSLDVSHGAVTFTSQSGTWDGIEFQNSGTGTLKNCTFDNTISPITVDITGGSLIYPTINIDSCIFTQGPITITNRDNVNVDHCNWSYTASIGGSLTVCGIDATGSGGISLTNNTIDYYASTNSETGISLVYCSGSLASTNVITNASVGIFASNCDADIRYNTIKPTTTTSSDVGIGLFDCSSAVILYDTVTSYDQGINLDGSSPVMHDNVVTEFITTGLYCNNSSSPRMTPTVFGGTTYWDAGLNNFQTSQAYTDGFDIGHTSKPNINEGYNTIYGRTYYINGDPGSKWDMLDNCWVDNPPNSGQFNITGSTYYYSPYSCTPPGGASGMWGTDNPDATHAANIEDPPQPLVVSYTTGVYDTIKTTATEIRVNADMSLYHSATKKALDNDFNGAITTYKQVVSDYKDSSSAIESMKRIFYCHERLHSDTATYAALRSYYINTASGNTSDTAFVKVAQELSRKCLVKKGQYSAAVGEYEDVVENSSDSTSIISAQVNIIEVYMLVINGEGDAPISVINGRLGYLKPTTISNGLAMIKEKLYHLKNVVHNVTVPLVFSLSQNYPNPFNPTTTIRYSIPKDVKVVIKIYDILGREVKTLVNDFKKTGFYEEKFDGSNIASGIYFYKIIAGDFIQSKKMVLVK